VHKPSAARSDHPTRFPSFCRYIAAEILSPFSLRIISDLVPFLAEATEETLALILEAIRAVIGVDGNVLDGTVTGQLAEVILNVWARNSQGRGVDGVPAGPPFLLNRLLMAPRTDPFLAGIVQEAFETIAAVVSPNDEVYNSLVQAAAPKLAGVIGTPADEENLSMPAAAFELAESILRGRHGGLGATLGEVLWPAAFGCLMTTDDMDSMQVCGRCPNAAEGRH
jgi:hypothetical protein